MDQLDIGVSRPNPVGDAVVIAIQSASKSAIDVAREILLKKGSGTLAQSITILPVELKGNTYTFQIEGAGYADFVDKGVDGTKVSYGSPYKFKSSRPSRSHAEAILKWIPVAGLMLSPAHPQIKTYKQMSWAIATAVKKHGIKPTPFMDNAFGPEYEQSLSDALTIALGRAVEIKFNQIADKYQ